MDNLAALMQVLWIFKWWILGVTVAFAVAYWSEARSPENDPHDGPGPRRSPLPGREVPHDAFTESPGSSRRAA